MAASSIHTSESFSFLFRPCVSDYCFINNHALQTLMATLDTCESDSNKCVELSVHLRDRMEFYTSYKCLKNSETTLIKQNFLCILQMIADKISAENVSVSVCQKRTTYEHAFASTNSKSEEIISFHPSGQAWIGLLGSECKGADADTFAGLPQAVQIACDLLRHMVVKHGVSPDDALVPFLICAGQCVQFGAVYCLPGCFYPVPLLLSERIDLFSRSGNIMCCRWILAMSSFLTNHICNLNFSPCVSTSQVVLSLPPNDTLFYKPLQLYGAEPSFYQRTNCLIEIFQRLWSVKKLRKRVVFPVGFLGYPDKSLKWCETMVHILDSIILREQFERQQKVLNTLGDSDGPKLPLGQPIMVFPNLLRTGWQVAGCYLLTATRIHPVPTLNVPAHLIEEFITSLQNMCQYFEQAKVCYFDMRLTNIFFKTKNDKLKIKMIDFDYCQILDEPLEPGFENIASDSYFFPNSIHIASKEWHTHMLDALIRDIRTAESNK